MKKKYDTFDENKLIQYNFKKCPRIWENPKLFCLKISKYKRIYYTEDQLSISYYIINHMRKQ